MRQFTFLLGIFLSLSLSGFAAQNTATPLTTSTESTNLLPVFPYADGWFGADDAYSIPLAPDKSLWLFGDTFVGNKTTKLRSDTKAMPRNSIGVSTCSTGSECSMQYYWRNPRSAKPRSYFDTGTDDVWYWPLDGYFDGHAVYFSMVIVRNKPGATSADAMGFEIAGTKWGKITNLSSSPDQWKTSISDLTGRDLWPGVSVVPDGDYLLLYTQVVQGEGKGYMTVLRIPKDKLEKPVENWEYLGADDKWHSGQPHGDAKHVLDQAISEMSVRYHPDTKKWVAISTGPEFPSNRIVARTADAATGPWSKPETIFEFPEMKPTTPGYDKDTFCYATKEHVEFEHSNLVLTYACNSFSIKKVMKDMVLYRPQVVVLDLPK